MWIHSQSFGVVGAVEASPTPMCESVPCILHGRHSRVRQPTMYASEAMTRLLYCCLLYTVATVQYLHVPTCACIARAAARPSRCLVAGASNGKAWYGMAWHVRP